MNNSIPLVSTGFAESDAALGIGGGPRGRITELLGMPTSGMTTTALALIGHARSADDLAELPAAQSLKDCRIIQTRPAAPPLFAP